MCSCSTSNVITAVVSCAVSFIIAALVGAVVHYCTVRKKCDCHKLYTLTIAHKQQKQQPAPVYDDIVSAAMETILSIGIGMSTSPTPHDNLTLLFSLQSTAVIPQFLKMAPLRHIRTHWRELRYSSDVTQGLSQLRE